MAGAPILELQDIDASADELRARRAGLPERAALRACEEALAALTREREEAEARRASLRREERRADALVADSKAKAKEVETALYSGKVTAARELEALQRELAGLQRAQREHEDAELAVLEQEEELDAALVQMESRRAQLEEELGALRVATLAHEQKIDAELERLAELRTAALPLVPAAWLGIYEKLRALPRLAGRVAVVVERGACSGCRMALPMIQMSRMLREPAARVDRCPHCTRIVVQQGPP
jgi:hypothetical protein